MSKHLTVSPNEAADRLAIRELVEAYAHCADRRDANGQMSLFTADTYFVVYMNGKRLNALSEAALARRARSSVCGPEQVRRHDALRRTEHDLHADRRSSHGGGVLSRASRHGREWQAPFDGRVAPLRRHVRKDRRGVALLGTAVVRGLDRRTSTVIMAVPIADPKRFVIVGANGTLGEIRQGFAR